MDEISELPATTSPVFVDTEDLSSAAGRVINPLYLAPEEAIVRELAELARLPQPRRAAVQVRAESLVHEIRQAGVEGGMSGFLRQYDLGSREGVILMCLAEALLRIPDTRTVDLLIADRVGAGDWDRHIGRSPSLLVNASTWGLALTGRLVSLGKDEVGAVGAWLGRLAGRIGEPMVRAALRQAMKVLGGQFVMGRTIEEALARAGADPGGGCRHSFDMLGEAALTAEDADHYYAKYCQAIAAIGAHAVPGTSVLQRNGISVKLSALHPRYEFAQRGRVMRELAPKLIGLVRLAREAGVGITVDAEEAERLELSLLLVDAVLQDRVLSGYAGFGLAVQAYQRRAASVLRWLGGRVQQLDRSLTVRLVKGAYWDTEIKRAQERGLSSYPVFTRKASTDVSYLACATLLHRMGGRVFPQFATHNAHTVAFIDELFSDRSQGFEFQRLHGMGVELYTRVMADGRHACRVYAPVGAHEDLLPYLVRRMLENGANSSFVSRMTDAAVPVEAVVADPLVRIDALQRVASPGVPDPAELFGAGRRNSAGLNLVDATELSALKAGCEAACVGDWKEAARISDATPSDIEQAVAGAVAAQRGWDATAVTERAAVLERAADAFEQNRSRLVALCVQEAGKTLPDALGEVREAVDFLRYYAVQAGRQLAREEVLPGPTGERNTLRLRGKGVFACISPWNFPLAIFTGQVAAALVAGNAVLAKPAEQTPRIAALAVDLMHRAGLPRQVLQFLPGDGESVGAVLTADPRIAGVVFTGSTQTARVIERSLAGRDAPIATLVAETGGLNAMIVDSSALAEQVVQDAVASGFNSAGQRCSALRLLLLQEEVADRTLRLLAGMMDELRIGDPALLSTDVGPVIDDAALQMLEFYADQVVRGARWHHRAQLPEGLSGRFFAPLAVEIPDIGSLKREVFGPVVHVVRYAAADLDRVIDAVNDLGYGLTLGVHTRIESVAEYITARARVGNIYVNRNIIGAVVGVQPFGGMGLSGTGPKAGGPHYLSRFVTEQTISVNTVAVGGNAQLMASEVE